ncbi:MAG: hypothetical protein OXT68_12130, partial [Chloroflexota bacterium]|nr:hypothetical protein [Chloroflexota bacterium]
EFEAQWYQNPPSNSGKKCPVLVNHYISLKRPLEISPILAKRSSIGQALQIVALAKFAFLSWTY